MYHFWIYASSVWTRRPFPRRPWLQVRTYERWTKRGSWPLLPGGQLVGAAPVRLLRSAARPRCSDPPSVLAASTPRAGKVQFVRRADTHPRVASSTARLFRAGTDTESFFPQARIARDNKKNLFVSDNLAQLRCHLEVIWLHLKIRVWPTFQVEPGLAVPKFTSDVWDLTPPSGSM